MLVIAHRGANREAQENSFSAFERAVEAGADRIELDVVISKDGQGIIVHEDDLRRVTGQYKKVSALSYEDVRQVKLTCGEGIPTLEECLDRFLPRIELNLELKSRNALAVAKILPIIAKHPLREKIIISSFYAEPLEWIAKSHFEVQTACLWGWFDYHDWPNSLANLAPQVMMERCRAQIFHPYGPKVDEHLMDVAKLHNWKVYPWYGVHDVEEKNPEGEWENLYSLGVDGICTNFPRQMVAWVIELAGDQLALSSAI